MTMATRIGVLDHGRLVQIGTPREIYESPRNVYVATRLGMPSINLMPAAAFAGQPMPPGTETIGARTEHVVVGKTNLASSKPAKVEWIEHLGDQNHLHLSLGGHKLVTLVDPDMPLSVGDAIDLTLRGALYFAADGERIAA
jgi:multiple sugar transport system ATP-binding protein